jgi:phosphonate transport system permease protein
MKAILFDGILLGYLAGLFLVAALAPGEDWLIESFAHASLAGGALLLAGCAVAAVLRARGVQTLGNQLFQQPTLQQSSEAAPSWYRTVWGWQAAVLFVSTFVASIVVTEFSLRELFSEMGFGGAGRIFYALVRPNFAVLPVAVLAIFETIFMAFLATALAIPPAFVLGFICAKNLMGSTPAGFVVYSLLRAVLNVVRSIEPLIWAIVFSVWVGIGPFAGMLALMVHTVASLAKQYSEMVESIDEGPVEGILATGAGPMQVVWYAVVPQIVLPYLAFTIYRWDINVRMSTIIGLVGGGGIGTLLDQYRGQAMWHEVGCLALVIVAAVWLMDVASAYIREALK